MYELTRNPKWPSHIEPLVTSVVGENYHTFIAMAKLYEEGGTVAHTLYFKDIFTKNFTLVYTVVVCLVRNLWGYMCFCWIATDMYEARYWGAVSAIRLGIYPTNLL